MLINALPRALTKVNATKNQEQAPFTCAVKRMIFVPFPQMASILGCCADEIEDLVSVPKKNAGIQRCTINQSQRDDNERLAAYGHEMTTIRDEKARIRAMGKLLLPWFASNKRPLPWREHYSPYAVWISEIMLQQTQMERGVSYFERWMRRFPDVAAVAAAPEEEILRLWEGLGYYSRARHLHRAAQKVMAEHGGVFPSELEHIRALPGVGPYTAGAIASIAFGHALPCVDANVERVLARVFDVDSPVKQEPAATRIRALALELVPRDKAREHNQAMMELGALVCRKKPRCEACPLAGICESFRLGITHERPVPGKKTAITALTVVTGVLRHRDSMGDRLFVQKRLDSGVWACLWEFPGGRVEQGESPESAVVREFHEETGFTARVKEGLGIIRHGYTTYRITLHCFGLELDTNGANGPLPVPQLTAASEYRWVRLEELEQLAMPAAHRKLADTLYTSV